METEDLFVSGNQESSEDVSSVLVAQLPAKCIITNHRGDEANLTLAGYELNFGNTFQVRVNGPVRDLRLVGYPTDLVRPQSDHAETDHRHNDRFLFIPIRVGPNGIWEKIWRHSIYARNLELDITTTDGKHHVVEMPVIILRSRTWMLMTFVGLCGVLTYIGGVILDLVRTNRLFVLTTPWPWLQIGFLAFLYAIWTFVRRFWQRTQRAIELKNNFRTRGGA